MHRLNQQCLWWRHQPDITLVQSAPIESHYDVAIIGAGFTGLWTAYFLKQQKPDWRIAVFEQHHVGYGASGRNGGWLIGGIAGQEDWLSSLPDSERIASQDLLYGIVNSVKDICDRESIDCELSHSGVLYAAARYPEQTRMAKQWLNDIRDSQQPESAFRWMNRAEAERHIALPKLDGGIFSPHCATLNPAKLVLGLAHTLGHMGVEIFENTSVDKVQPHQLTLGTKQTVQCEHMVVATEAFPATWQALSKKRLPVYSNVIATRALSAEQWQLTVKTPGLAFSDLCRSVTYGQRTQSGHLVFGARGGYQYGAKARFEFSSVDPAFKSPTTFLQRLFPHLTNADIQYRWAGSLAMSRAFRPFAGYDSHTGIAYAGGYGGEGVGASHLFGHTLADLMTKTNSERTAQPWVIQGEPSQLKNWEEEPLPWLGYQGIGKVFALEDWLCHEDKLPWLHKPITRLSRRLSALMH